MLKRCKWLIAVLLLLTLLLPGCITSNEANQDPWYQHGPFFVWNGAAWVQITQNGGGGGGSVWYAGNGAPAVGLGNNGDFYLDALTGDVYQKGGGVWSLVANIKGPAGAAGAPGAAGTPGSIWYSGSGAPAVGLGINGDYYLDNDNGDVYAKSGGVWAITTNITGPQGVPGTGGGGSALALYLDDTASGISTYNELLVVPNTGIATVTDSVVVNNNTLPIESYISAPLETTLIPGGTWYFDQYSWVSIATGTTTISAAVYSRTSGGTETLLFTATSPDINNLVVPATPNTTSITEPDFIVNTTDRLVVKYSATTTHNANVTVSFDHNGTLYYSHLHTTLATLGQFVWKGAYSGAVIYDSNNVVSYQGSSYICILITTGNVPTNTTYWNLLASKGDTGAAGATGATGPTGQGYTFKGAWVSGDSYVFYDNVTWGGATYNCILATSGTTSPDQDPTHWTLMVHAGLKADVTVENPSTIDKTPVPNTNLSSSYALVYN